MRQACAPVAQKVVNTCVCGPKDMPLTAFLQRFGRKNSNSRQAERTYFAYFGALALILAPKRRHLLTMRWTDREVKSRCAFGHGHHL